MRKKIFQFTTIATILLLGACSNEAQVHETNPIKGRTISLTASIPDDEPSTRVNLNQQVKNISITWVVGDQLQLAFVQGTSKIKENVTVTSISNNGKKAHFNIPIPDGWNGQFKLYGVYGGGGIDINGPNPVAILPANSGSASTLAALKNDVMLYFENDMQTTDTQSSVVFKHLGSIFSITLGNINQNAIDFIKQNEVNEARIKGVNLDVNWAYNVGAGGRSYDLVSRNFLNPETAGDYISFSRPATIEITEEPFTFWGWFPLLPEKVWPDLQLQLIKDGSILMNSSNIKELKTAAPIAGKSYYFYATIDVEPFPQIFFTNDAFVIVP